MKTKIIIAIIAVIALLLLAIGAFFLLRDEAKITLSFYSDGIIYHLEEINGKENIASPEAPAKRGYTFIGWYLDDSVWEKPFSCDKIAENPLVKNTNVYARFEPTAYSIAYVTDGATHSNPASYTIKDSITLTDAYKDGYLFCGWYSDELLQNAVTSIPLGSTGSITLYAKFELDEVYTITYSGITGLENANPLVYSPNTPTIILLPVSKNGYDFDGWFIGNNEVTEITMGTTGNITLQARFTPIQYTITYLGANGISHINPTSYTIESAKILLTDISKTGYTFDGWFDGTEQITEIPAKSTGNITLQAKFTPIAYTITYLGASGAGNPSTYTIESPTITLVDGSLDGHSFDGWFRGLEKLTVIPTGSTGNITLQAEFTPIAYTIIYTGADGLANTNPATYTVNTPTVTLANVSKPHYTFDGWFDGNQRVTQIALGSTGNKTLEARFTPITYTITYVNADGIAHSNKTEYTVETPTFSLASISKNDYIFDGWYIGDDKVTQIEKGTFGNLTVVARWTVEGYTISYLNTQGAQNLNQGAYDVEHLPLTLTDAQRNGYKFLGWYTALEGGSKVTEIPVGSSGEVTLYARWEIIIYYATFKADGEPIATLPFTVENLAVTEPQVPTKAGYSYKWESYTLETENIEINAVYTLIPYTVTYTGANGLINTNPTSYTVLTPTITLADVSKLGYTFDGWFDGDQKVTEIALGSTGNKTLEAKFTIITYTVTYNGASGLTNTNPTSFNINTPLVTLANVTKNGYTFDGWFSGNEKVTTVAGGATESIVLEARFTPIRYTVTYLGADGIANENPKEFTVETPTVTLKDISKVGYTFDGWFIGNQKVTEIPLGSTESLVLTAKWTVISYTITYYGVDGAQHSNLGIYNIEVLPLTLSDASKEGYTFLGWYTMAEGGSKVTTLPITHTGELKLYAHWEVIKYTASFYVDGALKHTVTFTYFDNSLPSVPALEQRAGYTAKWSDLTVKLNDFRVDAIYTPITYNITYKNLRGSANSNPSTYNVLSSFSLTAPTNSTLAASGITFVGWYLDGNPITSIPAGTTGDITLLAKWSDTRENVTYEQYLAMTPAERLDFYNSFAQPSDFTAWFNAAKAKYEEEQNREVIGDDKPVEIN